ncbi:PREDICTED: uncharacterized protein LOC109115066 [Nelumbo nucifera]|uniref:Uncharacterized protein LOC109115066 n=1 Tax=Nelumbo nucifera TaxID=4432 RepID=A0A1U8Q843_NELNU|nr:PREDICTED: uncharacterized protein LOC109115066 [Nelumbo nucifera]
MEQPPRFSGVVKNFGMKQCQVDHSVFSRDSKYGKILLIVYVDDIVITSSDNNGIDRLKNFLQNHFHMKDLGKVKYFLGIEVARSRHGVNLCQRKYVLDLFEEIRLLGAKPAKTPMELNAKFSIDACEEFDDPRGYKRLVRKLNYLTITIPDISFVVSMVNQFIQHPRVLHGEAVLRIVRYLKGAPGHGLLYKSEGTLEI